jgi:HNH endonuclease
MSWTESLRRLGMCSTGGAHFILKKYAGLWGLSTEHFDPYAASRGPRDWRRPLDEILVMGSSFSRGHLKTRLYEAGLKQPRCELCGQGDVWCGRRMALTLDHINGVSNDNRLENLQIVCPNCAATLDTHCGKHKRVVLDPIACPGCRTMFVPKKSTQKYCTRDCAFSRVRGVPQPERRRVVRPPYSQLVREISALGWSATGRRHGVSDNAVRKWIRAYERELERTATT